MRPSLVLAWLVFPAFANASLGVRAGANYWVMKQDLSPSTIQGTLGYPSLGAHWELGERILVRLSADYARFVAKTPGGPQSTHWASGGATLGLRAGPLYFGGGMAAGEAFGFHENLNLLGTFLFGVRLGRLSLEPSVWMLPLDENRFRSWMISSQVGFQW